MTLAMMNTHKAFKRLQRAGINDRQAEAMVAIFSELQQDNALSRADVMRAFQFQNQHIMMLSTQLKKAESDLRTETGDVAKGVEVLQTDNDVFRTDIVELKTDVAELKADVAELKTDVAELKTDVAELKTDVGNLKNDMCWVKRLMMVMTTTLLMATMKYMLV